MPTDLTPNAKRALLFMYVLEKDDTTNGLNDRSGQLKVFQRISGLGEAEAVAAFAELEDAGMVDIGE